MTAAAFFRVKKLKGGNIITTAARHNRREIQAELGAVGAIDPARMHLNFTLEGPAAAADVGVQARSLMLAAGVGALRKDAVQALELVFSVPPASGIDHRVYFDACTAWAARAYGCPVLSADVHLDEAAPHAHVLLLPLVNGRMVGSDLVGGKQALLAKQKEFHAEVASQFGLHQAPARLSLPAKQACAKAVLRRLRETGDSALQSAAWALIRDAVERDPAPFALALGIELEAPAPKKPRTMAQIFTSKGKGAATEKASNPIGFKAPEKDRTLCSVGFAPKPPPPDRPAPAPPRPAPPAPAPAPAPPPAPAAPAPHLPGLHDDDQEEVLELVTRIKDCDLDPSCYDPDSGDFRPPPPPAPRRRDAADAWVAGQLHSIKASRMPRPH